MCCVYIVRTKIVESAQCFSYGFMITRWRSFFLPHVDALCLLNAIKYRYLWNCTSWIGLLIYNRFRVALNCGFDVKSVFVSIPLFCSESRNILISGGISAVVWNPTNYPFVLFTLDCIFICLKNWLCYFPSFSESILFRSVL